MATSSVVILLPALAKESGLAESTTAQILVVVGITEALPVLPIGMVLNLAAMSRFKSHAYYAFLLFHGTGTDLAPSI